MTHFTCERCGAAFESGEARCPKCLRKSSVRAIGEVDEPEAESLARGERSSTLSPRVVAVGAALAIATVLGIAIAAFDVLHAPSVAVGWTTAALALLGAAITLDVARPLSSFGRGVGIALALGLWAFVSTTLARVMSGGLSVVLTVVLAACVFGGGVLPWLVRSRREGASTSSGAGKWR